MPRWFKPAAMAPNEVAPAAVMTVRGMSGSATATYSAVCSSVSSKPVLQHIRLSGLPAQGA